jgi:gliding motility-associated-like protein
MCFTVEDFTNSGDEWIHAIIPTFGPAWDPATIVPGTPPPACSPTGEWGWYESWTGCFSGNTHGPGFAFDSDQGLACGAPAGVLDGDPGNNYGDGVGACSNINPGNALTFCWDITVGSVGSSVQDFVVYVEILTDGQSGSYVIDGCYPEPPICWPEIENVQVEAVLGCPGEPFTLIASYDSPYPGLSFGQTWTGPDGFTSTDAITTATQPGTYTYTIGVTDCVAEERTIEVTFPDYEIVIDPPSPVYACLGQDFELTATTVGFTGPIDWYEVSTGNLLGQGGTLTHSIDFIPAASYLIRAEATTPEGCAVSAEVEIGVFELPTVTIEASPLDDVYCLGDYVVLLPDGATTYEWADDPSEPAFRGIDLDQAGTFSYTVIGTDDLGCVNTATIELEVANPPTASIAASAIEICAGETVDLTASGGGDYDWSTGASGPTLSVTPATNTTYTVTVTDANDCSAEASVDISVIEPTPAPTLTCFEATNNSLTIDWDDVPGASYYQVWQDGVEVGPTNNSIWIINNLSFSQTVVLEVQAIDSAYPDCAAPPATISCTTTAPNCDPVDVNPEAVAPLCRPANGDPLPLISLAANPSEPGGTLTWTGSNIVDGNAGTFDPNIGPPGIKSVTASYTIGFCTYTENLEIVVNQTPTADFTLTPGSVCINTPVTATYTGPATPAATYTWTFPDGDPATATGVGPHAVSWDTPGTYTASLTVTENGCTSPVFTQPVTVVTPLAAPTITCQSTVSTVTFDWADVPGAEGYDVVITSGTPTSQTSNSVSFTGLLEGEAVSIAVTALGSGPCGDSPPATLECSARVCPTFTVAIDPLADQCLDGSAAPVELLATVTGGNGTGTLTWSGPGVSGTTFSPTTAGAGTHTITALYNESGCTASAEVTVEIFPRTTLEITPVDPVCAGSDPIQLVTNVPGATFSGDQVSSTGLFTPAVADTATITATATDANGCATTEATLQIVVNPVPVAGVSSSATAVCTDEPVTITFTGTALNTATYTWDFAGGTATPGGNARGPHTVSWADGGTKTISLTVTQNGCVSSTETVSVTVSEPLTAPVALDCSDATASSVTFNWEPVPGATGYDILVLTGPAGTQNGTSYTMTGLNDGQTVSIRVTPLSATPCGDGPPTVIECSSVTCPPTPLEFAALPPTCAGAGAGSHTLAVTLDGNPVAGANFALDGTPLGGNTIDLTPLAPGTYTVTADYTDPLGCTFTGTTDFIVHPVPTAAFDVSADEVCTDATATFSYTGTASAAADYSWSFDGGTPATATGPGPHDVLWTTAGPKIITLNVSENGCAAAEETVTVEVTAPLAAPVALDCQATTTSVTFAWDPVPGASNYQVTPLSGPTGTLSGTTYTMTGLTPEQAVAISVVAVGPPPCGNGPATTIDCAAAACVATPLVFAPLDELCTAATGNTVTLAVTLDGTPVAAEFSFDGGPFTTDNTIDANGLPAGTYPIAARFDAPDACRYEGTAELIIRPTPTADFSVAPDPVCTDTPVTLTYTGTATAAADYSWTFPEGTPATATGQVPPPVSWATPGTRTLELTVVEDGCAATGSATVTVEEPLASPDPTCSGATTASVVFSWPAVPGAVDYDVVVTDGPTGTLNGTQYTITGLMPEQNVSISVVAVGDGPCGNSAPATVSCSSEPCENLTIATTYENDICLYPDAAAFQFTSLANGQPGDGTYTYSGPGVTGSTFDPVAAGPGSHSITVVYEEGNCSATETFVIEVYSVPSAAFTLDAAEVCIDQPTELLFTGTLSPTASYDYSYDGASVTAGPTPGNFTLSWAESGTKTVTIRVTENGCVDSLSQSIAVADPLPPIAVDCGSITTDAITFSWDPVPGVDSYTVVLPDQSEVPPNGTNSHTLSGLQPGETAAITVIGNSAQVCGPTEGSASCAAAACPETTFTLSGPEAICTGSEAEIRLAVSGGIPGDTYAVTYTREDGSETTRTDLTDGDVLFTGTLTADATFTIVAAASQADPDCSYAGATWSVTVDQISRTGTQAGSAQFCLDGSQGVVALRELLTDADPGGTWVLTDGPAAGLFDPATGNVAVSELAPGTYTFAYEQDNGTCGIASTSVQLTAISVPDIDAGDPQALTCVVSTVSIGSGTPLPGVSYSWTVNDSAATEIGTLPIIDVTEPGTYTLTATNEFGCSASDEVVVTLEDDMPTAEVQLSQISCFAAEDGAITVTDVAGGQPPYRFSLNGSTFTQNNFFTGLSPNQYNLIIQDNNGCVSEVFFDITQPDLLQVSLNVSTNTESDTVRRGDQVTITANISGGNAIDTIIWEPDTLMTSGDGRSIDFEALESMLLRVTVIDEQGCSDSEELTLVVRQDRPVYIPRAFSPNRDGTNDVFYIFGDERQVEEIESFLIFNRWGETIWFDYNFQPNDPAHGWDGTHRGQPLNPNVFVYQARVRFSDGETILYKGDVVLMR